MDFKINEYIEPIIMWISWSLTYIFNKLRKWENMTLSQRFYHLFISWFIWLLSYEIIVYFWINWWLVWFIIWIVSYSSIAIIDSYDKRQKVIVDNLFNKIENKIWK
jgi:hypothetical protein